MRDYRYYGIGCDRMGVVPAPLWKFEVSYYLYRRHFYDAVDFDLETGAVHLKDTYFPMIPWMQLRRLARAVDLGKELAQKFECRFDDDGGRSDDGGPTVREPRRPKTPVLPGASARSLPNPHRVDPRSDYDRSLLY